MTEAATLAKIEADYRKSYEARRWLDLRAYGGARLDVLPANGGWQVEINVPRKRDFLDRSQLARAEFDFVPRVSPLGPDFMKFQTVTPRLLQDTADVRNLLERMGFDLNKIPGRPLGDFESTPVVALLDQQTWLAVVDPRNPTDDPTRFKLWQRIMNNTNPLLDGRVQPHTLDEIKEWRAVEMLPKYNRPRHLYDGLPDPSKWFTDLRKDAAAAIEWCAQDTPEAFAHDGWGARIKKWVADHFTTASDLLRNRAEARDRKEAARVQGSSQPQPKPAPSPDRSQPKSEPTSWRGPSR